MMSSGCEPSLRNWKCAPVGIATETPATRSVTSSRSPILRQIRPRPRMTHHSSSMVRCATALEMASGGSVNIAIAPRDSSHKRRTSEPSSAITSGSGLIHLLGNSGELI